MKQCAATLRVAQRHIGSNFAERFWSKVELSSESNGCWLWRGRVLRSGYGTAWKDGTYQYAHRIAYELKYGEIPEGMCVCHKCDNPPCCRPDHLFIGSQEENMHDMRRKGRNSHPLKLTEQAVLEIRRRYADRKLVKVTMQQLGDEYGVYKGYISKIIHRQKWRHI
ncbi:MAG TPA: HNH endonuclease signature motif containing protein [Pyrinomonadaceae bacterium]|jgi:hypothetical protein